MAYTTINKSTDYFNTKLYSGTGSSQNITGVGFQPDFIWAKKRNGAVDHGLFDAIRGATKIISSNLSNVETTASNTITAFGSDGFTTGGDNETGASGGTYVAWNWKAGTAVSGNTSGSGTYKTYTGSVNTTSGFSIIKYEGNGTSGHTIPHHLGVAPELIIMKTTSTNFNWISYHEPLGNTKSLSLNGTDGVATSSSVWNNTTPTSSVFTVGSSGATNGNGTSLIAYCFAKKQGYSKFGSYVGNGNVNGPMIYTGFSPAFVIIKRTNTSNNWIMFDNKRDPFNEAIRVLFPNQSTAEDSGTGANDIDFLSNGIKLREDNGELNGSGDSYIYIAFAEAPLVGTNNIPANAR